MLIGSFDNGDPNTTNLYIGNINPKVGKYSISFKLQSIGIG